MRPPQHLKTSQAGLSLLEVLLAVTILAGAVLAASGAFQSVTLNGSDEAVRRVGRYLLDDAVATAQRLPRTDPELPLSNFGKEVGELPSTFDDVDDLDGRTEDPATDLGGTAFSGWQRLWTVESVDPDDPSSVLSDGSTNLLRVTVSAQHTSGELLTVRTLIYARVP